MAYKEFQLKDAAGIVRTINLSTDRRGVAQDGGGAGFNRGLSRPRNARDQEMPEAPDRLDPGAAVQAICEILAKVGGDPDAIMSEVAQNMAGGSQDAAGSYPQRNGFIPNAGGKTSPPLQRDAPSLSKAPKSGFDRRPGMDAALPHPPDVFDAYPGLRNIRLAGR